MSGKSRRGALCWADLGVAYDESGRCGFRSSSLGPGFPFVATSGRIPLPAGYGARRGTHQQRCHIAAILCHAQCQISRAGCADAPVLVGASSDVFAPSVSRSACIGGHPLLSSFACTTSRLYSLRWGPPIRGVMYFSSPVALATRYGSGMRLDHRSRIQRCSFSLPTQSMEQWLVTRGPLLREASLWPSAPALAHPRDLCGDSRRGPVSWRCGSWLNHEMPAARG